jgi:hypothetical protein
VSTNPKNTCGIRNNPTETLIARVAKFKTGSTYAYQGGDIIMTPEGYRYLAPSVAKIAMDFEQCKINDFAAYDVHENALSIGCYGRSSIGSWLSDYHGQKMAKVYSPDIYNRYYRGRRMSKR